MAIECFGELCRTCNNFFICKEHWMENGMECTYEEKECEIGYVDN